MKRKFKMIESYMNDIGKTPLLTPDQEKELTTKYYETQDIAIRNKIVTHNLRLVISIAKKYSVKHGSRWDLVQEGNYGLIKGVDKFDPTKDIRLSTYVSWWIRAYILRFVINNAHVVKIGTTSDQRVIFFNVAKLRAKLSAQGNEVTDERLAEELEVKEKSIREVTLRMGAPLISIDTPANDSDSTIEGSGDVFYPDRLDRDDTLDTIPSKLVEELDLKFRLGELASKFSLSLQDKHKEIFNRRFIQEEPDTLQNIGDDLSLTRERIRQIESKIKTSFGKYLTRNNISL